MNYQLRWMILLLMMLMISCQPDKREVMKVWKQEIIDTEHAFSAMAGKEGIQAAFLAFASDSVTVLRGNELIKGKKSLKEFYEERLQIKDAILSWSPDFVEVSSSGDLGYTYGKYIFTSTDSLGNKKTSEGIFHTVWKRQPDGSWKFVWD